MSVSARQPVRFRLVRPAPLAALMMAIVLAVLLGVYLVRGYAKAEADARLIAVTLGQAVEQHVAGQMRGISTLLEEAAALVAAGRYGDPEVAGHLNGQLQVFPEIRGLILVEADGGWEALVGTEGLTSDQAEWLASRALVAGSKVLVAPPALGQDDHTLILALPFVRDGAPAIIVTKLEAAAWDSFLETVLVPETAAMAVLHRDQSRIAAIQPASAGTYGAIADEGLGAVVARLPLAGIDLDVWVAMDRAKAFELWRGNAGLGVLLLLLLGGGLLLWAWRIDGAWRDLIRSRDGLENLVVSRGEELREATARLERQARRVSAAHREVQRLSMVTAHHLQEPLRPLVSYSQIMLRQSEPGQVEIRDGLEHLVQGGKDLKVLLRGFQQRVSVLGLDVPEESADLRQMIQHAMVDAGVGTPIRLGTLPDLQVKGAGLEEILVQTLRTLDGWRVPAITIGGVLTAQGWALVIQGGTVGGEASAAVRVCQSLASLHGLELGFAAGAFTLPLPQPAADPVEEADISPAPAKGLYAARLQALVMVLALGAAIGWQVWREHDSATHAALVLTQAVANSIDRQISGSLRGIDTVLAEAAAMIRRGDHLNRAFSARMETIRRAYPEIRHVSLAGPDGQMGFLVWPNRVMDKPIYIGDRSYFQRAAKALDQRFMAVGDPVVGRIGDERSFHAARALQDDQGGFAGVVYANLDPDVYAAFLSKVLLDVEGGTALIGGNGLMIARAPLHQEKFGIDISKSDLFTKWLPAAPIGMGRLLSQADGNDKFIAYRLLSPYPLVVTSGISRNKVLHVWRRNAWAAAWVGLTMTLVVLSLAWAADRAMTRIRRQQAKLQADVERRTHGLEAARALSDSRAAGLQSLNDQLHDLLAVATRDLHAPLATLRRHADLVVADLARQGRVPPDELGYVLAALSRLTVLLRDFQRFVSVVSQTAQRQVVDMGGLVRLVADEADNRFGQGILLVQVGALPSLYVDGGMMMEMLSQIFANAVVYRGRTQAVTVKVAVRSLSDGWLLEISDDGPGFPADQLSHDPQVFEAGQGQSADSTGIGLAICRVIAQAHGGELWLANRPEGGALISVSLPGGS